MKQQDPSDSEGQLADPGLPGKTTVKWSSSGSEKHTDAEEYDISFLYIQSANQESTINIVKALDVLTPSLIYQGMEHYILCAVSLTIERLN